MELLPSAQFSSWNEVFVRTSKNLLKIKIELFRSALFNIKARICLKYFVNNFSLIVNLLCAKKATMKKSCFHNVADSRPETVVKHDLTEDILLPKKKLKQIFP